MSGRIGVRRRWPCRPVTCRETVRHGQAAPGRQRLSPAASQRLDRLMADYDELLERAERMSRRFRNRYRHATSRRYALADVRAYGRQLRTALQAAKAQRKAEKKAGKT